jgi:hypothetical protein
VVKRTIVFRDNVFFSATYEYSDGSRFIDYNYPESWKK